MTINTKWKKKGKTQKDKAREEIKKKEEEKTEESEEKKKRGEIAHARSQPTKPKKERERN